MSTDRLNPPIGASLECASIAVTAASSAVAKLGPADVGEPTDPQHDQRFGDHPGGASTMTGSVSLLAAVATAVRGAQPIVMQLSSAGRQIEVQLWPREQRYVCVSDLAGLASDEFLRLTLVRLSACASAEAPSPMLRPVPGARSWPLAPLLWRLAMHSGSGELLPEIAGPVLYRVAPGLSPEGLPNHPAALALILRLRGRPVTLDELSGHTVLGKARAKRLLNALHLQCSLIVSKVPTTPSLHDAPGRGRTPVLARLRDTVAW